MDLPTMSHIKKFSEFINEEATPMQPAQYGPKKYYCPVCGHEQLESTNHTQPVGTCKVCYNSPLYLVGNDFDDQPFIMATFHYYHFDLDITINFQKHRKTPETETQGYNELVSRLKGMRYKKHTSDYKMYEINKGNQKLSAQMAALKKHDGEEIKIYNPERNDGYYYTSIGGLHSWHEVIVENNNIKTGYYLEINK